MTKYSVPIITETTDVYEVEARTKADAALMAATARAEGVEPTRSYRTKFVTGNIAPTVEDPNRVAGGGEHIAAKAAQEPLDESPVDA